MAVITNTILLVRRIADLQRRRESLVQRQDRMRRCLPDWTFAPLQLVGMTSDEIKGFMTDLTRAEADAGLDEIEREIDQIDKQIEELENMLLATPARSLDGIAAVLDMAVARFRDQTASDPDDVFYDYGDARMLFFLERVAEDVHGMMEETQRRVG